MVKPRAHPPHVRGRSPGARNREPRGMSDDYNMEEPEWEPRHQDQKYRKEASGFYNDSAIVETVFRKPKEFADLHEYDDVPEIDRVPTAVGFHSLDSAESFNEERSRHSRYEYDLDNDDTDEDDLDGQDVEEGRQHFEDDDDIDDNKYSNRTPAETRSVWSDSTDSNPPVWRSYSEEASAAGNDWATYEAKRRRDLSEAIIPVRKSQYGGIQHISPQERALDRKHQQAMQERYDRDPPAQGIESLLVKTERVFTRDEIEREHPTTPGSSRSGQVPVRRTERVMSRTKSMDERDRQQQQESGHIESVERGHVESIKSGSAKSGSAKNGSIRKEPAKADSIKSGSAKSGSAKDGSAKNGSQRSTSVKSRKESAKADSIKSGSAKSGSAKNGSQRSTSVKSRKESAKTDSIKSGSAKSGSAKDGSAKNGSQRSTSVKSRSIKKDSAKTDSVKSGSTKSGSAKDGSAKNGSQRSTSVKSRSVKKESAKTDSVKSGSAKSASAKDGSAKNGSQRSTSVKSRSVKKESAKTDSVKSGSAKSGSAKDGSAKNGSQRSTSVKSRKEAAKNDSIKSGSAKSGSAKNGSQRSSSVKKGSIRTDAAKTDSVKSGSTKNGLVNSTSLLSSWQPPVSLRTSETHPEIEMKKKQSKKKLPFKKPLLAPGGIATSANSGRSFRSWLAGSKMAKSVEKQSVEKKHSISKAIEAKAAAAAFRKKTDPPIAEKEESPVQSKETEVPPPTAKAAMGAPVESKKSKQTKRFKSENRPVVNHEPVEKPDPTEFGSVSSADDETEEDEPGPEPDWLEDNDDVDPRNGMDAIEASRNPELDQHENKPTSSKEPEFVAALRSYHCDTLASTFMTGLSGLAHFGFINLDEKETNLLENPDANNRSSSAEEENAMDESLISVAVAGWEDEEEEEEEEEEQRPEERPAPEGRESRRKSGRRKEEEKEEPAPKKRGEEPAPKKRGDDRPREAESKKRESPVTMMIKKREGKSREADIPQRIDISEGDRDDGRPESRGSRSRSASRPHSVQLEERSLQLDGQGDEDGPHEEERDERDAETRTRDLYKEIAQVFPPESSKDCMSISTIEIPTPMDVTSYQREYDDDCSVSILGLFKKKRSQREQFDEVTIEEGEEMEAIEVATAPVGQLKKGKPSFIGKFLIKRKNRSAQQS